MTAKTPAEGRRPFFYVLEGHTPRPVTVDEYMDWRRSLGEKDVVHVGDDTIGEVRVSTVFLGMDHNHWLEGPPILFETMIFGGDHDDYQKRYETWGRAEAGHAYALELVKMNLRYV